MTDRMQLTEGERNVLTELVEAEKELSAYDLAKTLNETAERIISILNSLSEAGLVNVETHEISSFSLTDEGLEYAENGLPETRLFNAVKDQGGKATLEEALAEADLTAEEKGLAIMWSKKNGWIRISKDDQETILTTATDETEGALDMLLENLRKGGTKVSDDYSEELKQALTRSLVNEKKNKVFRAEIKKDKIATIQAVLQSEAAGTGSLTPEMLITGSWKNQEFRPYNMEIAPGYVNHGRKHHYAEFIDWLKEILIGLGFNEWFGPYVETEFWNNDTLFVPQDHVAREEQDQFRVSSPYAHGDIVDEHHYKQVKGVHEDGGNTGSTGWQRPFSREVSTRLVLRSHTTPVSMRYLAAHTKPPHKMFIIDRNFRSEKVSATHAQEFDQCEGIIWDKGLNLRDLMGYISEICRRVGLKKMKFKPGQFPFTEPSIEGFAKHDTLGWIEVAPGGIFRPEVTYPLGIKERVLAWGLGASRMYMASMDIRDIRDLFSRDLTWLRKRCFVG